MKISFVIPAYNEEEYIGMCLDSIFHEIGNRTDCEVIVVNNNSTDRTVEIITTKFPRAILLNETKHGANAARETGFRAAQGELVAFPDADTHIPKGWLAHVEKEFEKNKNLVCVSGPFIYYDLPVWIRALVRVFYYLTYIIYIFGRLFFHRTTVTQGGNYVVRRDALKSIGGHNANISFYGDDTDLAVRLSKVGFVKFTFHMPTFASGRRLAKEGAFTTGVRYTINNFWMIAFRRPYTLTAKEVRLKNKGEFYDPENKTRERITAVLFTLSVIIFFGVLFYVIYKIIMLIVIGAINVLKVR